MADYPAPSPPYAGPPFRSSGTGNKPIRRITIHSTVGPTADGSRQGIAAYFRSSRAGGSAHYVVDAGGVLQTAWDSVVCWHAPPNPNSIGIEMCDYPTQTMDRWANDDHKALLERTARLTAELCLAYDVRPWFVSRIGLRAGRSGVTTHNEVSQAFHQSTHWDPGAWPRRRFMRRVRAIRRELLAETTTRKGSR